MSLYSLFLVLLMSGVIGLVVVAIALITNKEDIES